MGPLPGGAVIFQSAVRYFALLCILWVCLINGAARADVDAGCVEAFARMLGPEHRAWVEQATVPGGVVALHLHAQINVRVLEKTKTGFSFAYLKDGELKFDEQSYEKSFYVQKAREDIAIPEIPPDWKALRDRQQARADAEKVRLASEAEEMAKYKPIEEPDAIVATDVLRASTAEQLRELEKLGVGYLPTGKAGWVPYSQNAQTGAKESIEGAVVRITDLPKPLAKGTGLTPAFKHPDMAKYKRKIEAAGYELVVDTTLLHSGAGGYHTAQRKVIALRPDSPWHVVKHEFEHLEFDLFLAEHRMVKKETRGNVESVLPKELVAMTSRQKAKKVANFRAQGLPEKAINETLAVTAEIEALGFRRFIPSDEMRVRDHARQYALRHQRTELLAIKERTPAQENLLNKVRAEMKKLETESSEARFKRYKTDVKTFAAGFGGAGVAALAAYAGLHSTQVREVLFSDEKEVAYIKDDQDRWIEVQVSSKSSVPRR